MVKRLSFGLLVLCVLFGLNSPAHAQPRPMSDNLYERIGATQGMSDSQLRRAYLVALNSFDPSSEEFARIKEAGEALFKFSTAEQALGVPEMESNLNVARLKKMYDKAKPLLNQLKAAANQPRALSEAQFKTMVRQLENELTVNRQNLSFVFTGKMRAPTYADILVVLKRAENFDKSWRADVVDHFIDSATSQVEAMPSVAQTAAVAAQTKSGATRTQVYVRAMAQTQDSAHIRELLAAAFIDEGVSKVDQGTKRTLLTQALTTSVKGEASAASPYLVMFLRTMVQEQVTSNYDRARLLRSIEPVLALEFNGSLLGVMTDIARSDWLPFDVTVTAQKILRQWKHPLDPELAPLNRPFKVCMRLLTKRTLDWFTAPK